MPFGSDGISNLIQCYNMSQIDRGRRICMDDLNLLHGCFMIKAQQNKLWQKHRLHPPPGIESWLLASVPFLPYRRTRRLSSSTAALQCVLQLKLLQLPEVNLAILNTWRESAGKIRNSTQTHLKYIILTTGRQGFARLSYLTMSHFTDNEPTSLFLTLIF